ncbi:Type II secretion system protein G precursor [compost metagenome]
MELSTKQKTGFTIVELLIVIVIIGILAAITIVAYNGIQNRARTAAVTSSLAGAAKQLELSKVDAGTYPSSGASLKKADDVDFQYSYTLSSDSYCLTATKDSVSYKILSTNQVPAQGGCPGHSQGGVATITNLMPNPSFEGSLTGWNNGMKTGDSAAVSSTRAFSGTQSLALTAVSSSVDSYFEDHIALQPGTYTISAYAYLTFNGPTFGNREAMFYNVVGLSAAPGTVNYNRGLLNQWQRVSATFTTSTAGTLGVRFYTPNGTSYFDGVMLTQGSTVSGYADGSTQDWIWTSTAHNSPSTGPPV